jgi:hypothetical protein
MNKLMTINLPKYIGSTALLAGTLAIASSAQAATLYSQANIVTNPGAGFNGADVSAFAPGASTFGFGATQYNNVLSTQPTIRLADDFTVPVGGWLVDSINVLAYVTGTSTTSPFTGISMNIWNGTPGGGGTIIASSSNLQNSGWSGIYRTTATTLTDDQRPVMNVGAAFPSLFLGQGTYWVDWSLANFTSDNQFPRSSWVPPVMTASRNLVSGNSLQLLNGVLGGWSNATDAGLTQVVELPFAINGTSLAEPVAVPEPSVAPALMVFGGFLLARRAVKRKLMKTEDPISFKA